jgi:hypothetical protein
VLDFGGFASTGISIIKLLFSIFTFIVGVLGFIASEFQSLVLVLDVATLERVSIFHNQTNALLFLRHRTVSTLLGLFLRLLVS